MCFFVHVPLSQNKEASRTKAAFTRSQYAFEHGADAAIVQKSTIRGALESGLVYGESYH